MAAFWNYKSLLSSACYAGAATIFYRKSFNLNWISNIAYLIVTGYTVNSKIIFLPMLVITGWNCHRYWNIIRNCKISTFFLFSVAILDAIPKVFDNYLVCTCILPLIAAVPQFIRRQPIKAKLQETRAKFGPIYILYGWRAALLVNSFRTDIGRLMIASACLSTLAGLLFRPDNGALLSIFVSDVTSVTRKTIHRSLMIGSFVWYVFSLGWFFF